MALEVCTGLSLPSRRRFTFWSEFDDDAWCEEAQDIRSFALANITEISLSGGFFERQSQFDLKTYSDRSFGVFQDDPVLVKWKFDSSVAHDVKDHFFHPTQQISENHDGTLTVSFVAAGCY